MMFLKGLFMTNKTKSPGKQRDRQANAPLHLKKKQLHAHLSKELALKYKKRAMQVRKGDEVVVLSGALKGKKGKVTKVSVDKAYLNVEGLQTNKKDGKIVPLKIIASKVVLTDLYKDDERRFKHKNKEVKKD